MTPLRLLGGNNGSAGPINIHGEIAGIVENGHHDTNPATKCPDGSDVLQLAPGTALLAPLAAGGQQYSGAGCQQ